MSRRITERMAIPRVGILSAPQFAEALGELHPARLSEARESAFRLSPASADESANASVNAVVAMECRS